MARISKRVFIRNARLSFPSLDEPRESMSGDGSMKYQATFILDPSNPSVKTIGDALTAIAQEFFKDKDKAARILGDKRAMPLKKGDDREKIPDGYAGNLYIAAKSAYKPELRDANPRILITDAQKIREKFVPGYRVNAFVDLYPYDKAGNKGIAAGLVSVQFAGYDEPFGGSAAPSASDFPDCSEASKLSDEAAQKYAASAPTAWGPEEDVPF